MRNPHTSSAQTVGGVFGHALRRAIHVSMIVFPVVFYLWGSAIASALHMLPAQFVLILLGVIAILEMLRIRFGVIVFAQRAHEVDHICSLAWTAIAISVVLICLPNPIYAIPIVAACAIGDPVLGELRGRYSSWVVGLIGAVVIALLWWFCSMWMPVAWWWPLILGPITVAAEWPSLKWIDDNAMMMWVGLLFVILVA